MNCYLRRLAPLLCSAFWVASPVLGGPTSDQNLFGEGPSSNDLRGRLTEREDETRVEKPYTIPVFGHPLSVTLQYELSFDWIRQITESDPPDGATRVLLEQQAEPEMFYTLGPVFSLLAQARVAMEQDLRPETRRGVSDVFVERGEMWLYSEQLFGSSLDLEIGRLDFEDDRRWWWDEDLDALRVTAVGESLELALAVAQELGPTRSDRGFVDPDNEEVLRVIAEASWDWDTDHAIELFALFHDDHSRTPQAEEVVDREREDEGDAKLTWLGVRATGAWAAKSSGILGYWLDAARVRGDERAVDFMPLSERQSVVEERMQLDVHGWGFDAGATWIAPLRFDPRLTLGYAKGSGDPNDDDVRDRAFRQTGLNGNEPGFGGVQSFAGYGLLLDPDLSNLMIVTVGVGLSLLTSSSLDLVYHAYRQVEPADSLLDARLEASLTGRDRGLGYGLDLALAIEERDWLELELTTSAFRAGDAFGSERGKWAFGSFAAVRFAF